MSPDHLERELCDLDERGTLTDMSVADLVNRVRVLEHRVAVAEHVAYQRNRRSKLVHTFGGPAPTDPAAFTLEARIAGRRALPLDLVDAEERRDRMLSNIDEHAEAQAWDEQQ